MNANPAYAAAVAPALDASDSRAPETTRERDRVQVRDRAVVTTLEARLRPHFQERRDRDVPSWKQTEIPAPRLALGPGLARSLALLRRREPLQARRKDLHRCCDRC